MQLDRTWYDTLQDESAPGAADGSVWDKADVDALLDAVDVEIARIDAAAAALPTATAGQLVFPATQNPSTDANTLDDYDEGSWTPVIGGATSESGQTYLRQVGRFVKVGRLVTAWGWVTLSAKGTITGAVTLKGLPHLSANVTDLYGSVAVNWFAGMATTWVSLTGNVNPNAQTAGMYGVSAPAAGSTALATADIGNGTGWTFVASYFAGG